MKINANENNIIQCDETGLQRTMHSNQHRIYNEQWCHIATALLNNSILYILQNNANVGDFLSFWQAKFNIKGIKNKNISRNKALHTHTQTQRNTCV